MPRSLITRRRTLGAAGLALAATPRRRARAASSLDQVSFLTNWRAEAEHGGFYQALAAGIYRRYGLNVDLRQGGPSLNTPELLLAGRVDMILSTGMQALNYARDKLPFFCIAAIFQKDPEILMAHPGMGNDSLAALRSKPMMISTQGRATFWPFLRKKFGYSDSDLRPYNFNLQPFIANKEMVVQGYVTSEPYVVERAGLKPRIFLLADAGFASYDETIDISHKLAIQKPDVIQRFINASIEGWVQYLAGQDVAAANALIKKANPDMTDDQIAFSIKMLKKYGLIRSGAALTLGIGAMTDGHWKRFYDAMVAAGVYRAGIDYKAGYSLQFVDHGVGL